MAPSRQHTFTLVPNPLGVQGLMSRPASGPESKPPMTSKQAQKLYRQATRGPRLSKAEQRRIEREEQERIRRELAKDKQAAKARALREKKKAKEQQVLEEKRRRGLPLVDVRPSQDTISRFVRGNGAGKKRDATGTKVDLPTVEEEPDDIDRPRTEDGLEKKTSCEQGEWDHRSRPRLLPG
ncbi:1ea6d326-aa2d-483c-943c-e5ba6071ba7f [Thermothielavioides terrestris]|uniref:1ea6d326-aa2d-483c-943c-e5ba6071ba7f n=1 Tax=Thermothielavioides terrestris TaxID=2587410 RepID=A0A3S4AUC9_9PEZI|nr:1ea6d326-aa2d-483c-943c-e5ba6071ba7f [Thermothielavioides terrestris]